MEVIFNMATHCDDSPQKDEDCKSEGHIDPPGGEAVDS